MLATSLVSTAADTNSEADKAGSVAQIFINGYVKASRARDWDSVKWVAASPLATNNFKRTLKKMISDGFKRDPEVGLDSDPVGQRLPGQLLRQIRKSRRGCCRRCADRAEGLPGATESQDAQSRRQVARGRLRRHAPIAIHISQASRNPTNFGNLGASFAPLGWCLNFTSLPIRDSLLIHRLTRSMPPSTWL